MIAIRTNLLGIPEVFKGEDTIYFSYKKAEALFYYILSKKQVTRDEVVNLLWGNLDEDLAKKNLRNAVYSIRKVFNEDVIISPKRSLLVLNPNIQFQCDIYKISNLEDNFDEEAIKLYKGDFLECFYLKDAEAFEEWIIQEREHFKEKYIKKITTCIKKFIIEKDISSAKIYCNKLISIDDLNEEIYRILMKIYIEEDNYDKVISIYNMLRNKLRNELGVLPDEETENIYKKVKDRKFCNVDIYKREDVELLYDKLKEVNTFLGYWDYVYTKLSSIEKLFLHERAVEIIEEYLKNNPQDFSTYSKLIYHYKCLSNKLKELEYRIKNLNIYLSNRHEIFPILYNKYVFEDYNLTEKQLHDKFKEISVLIEELKNNSEDEEILYKLNMEFLFVIGRDLIRKGEYVEGITIINNLINDSLKNFNYQLLLQCYKQMIYYCINISDFSLMREYIEKSIKISVKNNFKEEIPIILRLKGYERIMAGKNDEGEKILMKAIDLLNKLKNRENYVLNIAAAYNFIGESKLMKREYEMAIQYYESAINICLERDINLALPILYTNAGQALYEIKLYDKAYSYIDKAVQLYDELNFIWLKDRAHNLFNILSRKKIN